jgi:putative transposase
VLLSVILGMRESHEDWLELGRDLIARGLGAPMLIVADGAPGLIKAIEQCWPASDRQHCAVHRVRKLPERERECVRKAYWQALDEAINERDGKQRLVALVGELDRAGYTAAARCLAMTSTRSSCTCATRPDTAAGGEARTCSNGRSVRSNAAPR